MTQQSNFYIQLQQFIYKYFAWDIVGLLPKKHKTSFSSMQAGRITSRNCVCYSNLHVALQRLFKFLLFTNLNPFWRHDTYNTALPLKICHREAQIVLTLKTFQRCSVIEDRNSTCMWEGTSPSFKKIPLYAEQHDWITQEWQWDQWRHYCRVFAWLPWNTSSTHGAAAVKSETITLFTFVPFYLLAARRSHHHACPAVNRSYSIALKLSLLGCSLWIITADGVWLVSMAHLMPHWSTNKGQWNVEAPGLWHWVHNKQHKIKSLFCRATEAVIRKAARVWPLTPTIHTIVPERDVPLYSCDTWLVRPTAE